MGIRAAANVPSSILSAFKLGISLALKLSLSELTVPSAKLDAFKPVRASPLATITPALKFPFASLTTIALPVLPLSAAIVAEFSRPRDDIIPAAVFFRMISSTEE